MGKIGLKEQRVSEEDFKIIKKRIIKGKVVASFPIDIPSGYDLDISLPPILIGRIPVNFYVDLDHEAKTATLRAEQPGLWGNKG